MGLNMTAASIADYEQLTHHVRATFSANMSMKGHLPCAPQEIGD
jgi:hypothetical protein